MQRIDLNGIWTMNAVSGRETDIPANVPGDTHSALLAAGKIVDPYWDRNENEVQWVSAEDWDYMRTVEIDDAVLAEDAVYLVCESLDTVAEIYVNDQLVGAGDNMFLRQVIDVKPRLVKGLNTIRIRLLSAEKEALKRGEALPYPIPYSSAALHACDMHRNLLRKVQCHGGWDWGISLMIAGIAGDISLQATSQGRIDYVYCTQQHRDDACTVTVQCEYTAVTAGKRTMTVELDGQRVSFDADVAPGTNLLSADIEIDKPRLWWPAGQGEQPLYDLKVNVGDDEQCKKIGLRSMELITEEDELGRSFTIRVNGRDIFCKGADWIPADAMRERVDRPRLRDLLTSAVEGNMNMLRIWGGGQYETDDFYELCDEFGIMIWQDFMFACSMYPSSRDFLASVRDEAEHQIKRLRDYACIALWCGNNENEVAFKWFKEARDNPARYIIDYDRLTRGVLGDAVERLDPTRAFWPSSPSAGPDDYHQHTQDESRGDEHYWGVWHGGQPFESYLDKKFRFCSEFGFQSFPSLDIVQTFAPPEQWNVASPCMEHHQRNRSGNTKIVQTFMSYFRLPNGFENFLYLSQVQQAVAVRLGVEHWRRLRPICMGTLIWQLNDNWPVASWASLEYGGKWKLLHYAAKRFYAPVATSVKQTDDGGLEFWVVSDELNVHDAELTIDSWAFDGTHRGTESICVSTPAAGAACVKSCDISDYVSTPTDGFLTLKLECNNTVIHNEHLFAKPKVCDLQAAAIKASFVEEDGKILVTVETDKPAFHVAMNVRNIRGEFDDNDVTLVPGEARTFRFSPKQDSSLQEIQNAFAVNHLQASYSAV